MKFHICFCGRLMLKINNNIMECLNNHKWDIKNKKYLNKND